MEKVLHVVCALVFVACIVSISWCADEFPVGVSVEAKAEVVTTVSEENKVYTIEPDMAYFGKAFEMPADMTNAECDGVLRVSYDSETQGKVAMEIRAVYNKGVAKVICEKRSQRSEVK